jgi:hypothetical protein
MHDKIVSEEEAIEVADQVERCVDGDCAPPAPGGRKFRDAVGDTFDDAAGEPQTEDTVASRTVSASSPPRPRVDVPARPLPAPKKATLVGRWRGVLTTTIAQPGQTPSKQSDEVAFEIAAAPDGTVVFWPNAAQKEAKCEFVATLAGTRAAFKAKKVCTLDQDGNTTSISVRSGSLELRGAQVHVQLVLDMSIRGKGGARMKGTITYAGSGSAN